MVHLRESEQRKASGPELPSGTELFVLDRRPVSRKGLPLYRVGTRSSNQTGYVFLSERELGPGCPFIWPEVGTPKPTQPTDTRLDHGPPTCFNEGTFQTVAELYDPECEEQHGKPKAAKYRLDIDGDGYIDELLDYGDELILAHHTKRGFRARCIAHGMDTVHIDSGGSWIEPVRAGNVVYIGVNFSGSDQYDDARAEEYSSYSLYRVRPDGTVFEVLSYDSGPAHLDAQLLGKPDGSIVISNKTGRSQTLRYDAALSRFVP